MLKGNAVVGQSGGPTAAINATLSGVIRGALECDSIETIYGAFNGIDGVISEHFCDLGELVDSPDKLSLLAATPAAALGSCRKKLPVYDENNAETTELYKKIFDIFKKYNIRYFFYIGGNDSMDTVSKLSAVSEKFDHEMRIMGVPKTIDNDLEGTDHTPGFGSAAKYIATSMQEILRDCAVYTTKAVTIVEIMGRDAGWLTASAALTGRIAGVAPDLIYLPETVFDQAKFMEDVRAALERHPNVVVAVSEGLRCADGKYVGESAQSGSTDVFGHKYLAGTGKALEMAVKAEIGCKVRSVELNILQRCAAHVASKTDIEESIAVGRAAVRAAENGKSERMMTIVRTESDGHYSSTVSSADIHTIANKVRSVPREFINERANYVTEECIDYILPLIMGELDVRYENGIPCHFEIKR